MRRSVYLLFAFLFGFAVIYISAPDSTLATYYGAAAQLFALAYAAWLLTRTGHLIPRPNGSRKGWLRLAVGLGVWTIAQLMEIWELILKQPGYGTIADCFWILGYLPVLGGLLLLFSSTKRSPGRNHLFALALLLGYCFVFYFFILPQTAQPQRAVSLRILDLAYPSFDFVSIALTAFLIRRSRAAAKELTASYWSLHFCFLLLLVSDILISYFNTSNSLIYQVLDLPYLCSYLLIVLAAQFHPFTRIAATK